MPGLTSTRGLVGRQHELATLRAALDATLSGQGAAAVLVGDAGIGKTSIVEAFADLAASRGMLVLWGRSLEQPGAPPYWPWVQILRRFAQSRDEQALRDGLGRGASYIAEICPDLRDWLPGLVATPQPLTDLEQARFRLFDAIAESWRRIAARQPLLLIFEDLHWADVPSLRLLEFCAGEIGDSRVLIVATLREAEGLDQAPILPALAALRHKAQQVPLTGLTRDETGLLLAATTGADVPDAMTGFVHEKTAGNPFFVSELAHWLVQEGMLSHADPILGIDPGRPLWRLPEGVRALISTRLNRVSTAARRVLRSAAVIGTRFSFGLLRRLIAGFSEDEILTALDRALGAHIIEETDQRGDYQFAHALTRDTLYNEIPALERARLHERAGAALEVDHQHNLGPHLWLLAHHFNAALPGGSCAKAITYAIRAGEQASGRLAYEEAARCFSLALNALDQSASAEAGLRCKLGIALGRAQLRSGHPLPALQALTEAAGRASHLGARNDMAEAAIEFEEVAWRLGLPGVDAVRLLNACLEHLDEGDGIAGAKLQSSLVRALIFAGMPDRAGKLHVETVRLARRVGDPEALEAALRSGFWLPWDPADLDVLLANAQETITLAQQIGNQERALDAAAFRLHLLMAVGDFAGFSSDLERFAHLAEELQQPFHQYHAWSLRAAQALLTGRFADAEALARAAVRLGRRLPGLDASGAFGMQMFALARERGELPQLAPLVRQFMQTTPGAATWRPALALVLAELGQHEEARAQLEQLAPRHFEAIARDSLRLACLAYLAAVCALTGDQGHAEELYALLAPWQGRNVVGGSVVVCYGPADHFLGMLAAVLRRWESAERHFAAATEMSRRQGFGPWLAHTQYQHAAMLSNRKQPGDLPRARALLERARQLSTSLGMPALRERVTQLEDSLDSLPHKPSYPGGLSRREVLVLRMVAAGKSNQAIAAAIFRSPNTVANHVRSILAKLGAANRTEAAALAARHGLL